MSNQFTPGPWRVDNSGFRIYNRIIASGGPGMPNCTVAETGAWADKHKEEQRANARLIATAPDLFEALVKCRDFLRTAPMQSGVCCCGDPVESHNVGSGHSPVDELAYAAENQIEQIEAALSRATGAS